MFTNEEVQFITAVFNKPSINPLDPKANETCDLVKGIVRKMNELKEKDNGEQSDGVTGRATKLVDLNNQPRYRNENSVA